MILLCARLGLLGSGRVGISRRLLAGGVGLVGGFARFTSFLGGTFQRFGQLLGGLLGVLRGAILALLLLDGAREIVGPLRVHAALFEFLCDVLARARLGLLGQSLGLLAAEALAPQFFALAGLLLLPSLGFLLGEFVEFA